MLIDNLLNYLTRTVSEARVSTYKVVLPFLYRLDPGTFELQFNQFTTYLDEFTTVDNVAQFDQIVTDLLAEGIEEFGLYLSDDQPLYGKLELLAKICQALYHVDSHEDLQSVKYALEIAEDPKEKIAEVLHVVDNTLDPNQILELTAEVSPSLLYRLRDYLNEMTYRFPEDDSIDTALVERTKNALNFYGIERAVRFFKDGGSVGEPLTNFLDYYFSEEKNTSEVIGKLAVFSAIAAGIPNDKIKERIGEELPHYFIDPKTLLTISRIVTKLPLPEFDHA